MRGRWIGGRARRTAAWFPPDRRPTIAGTKAGASLRAANWTRTSQVETWIGRGSVGSRTAGPLERTSAQDEL